MKKENVDKIEFGAYMKNLRGSKSTRQVEIATGVSKSYISLIERGLRDIPTPEILEKLSKAYNASYDDLMEKAGYVNSKSATTIDISDIIIKELSKKPNLNTEMIANQILEDITKNYSDELNNSHLSFEDKALISKVAKELGKKTPEADVLRKMLKGITE